MVELDSPLGMFERAERTSEAQMGLLMVLAPMLRVFNQTKRYVDQGGALEKAHLRCFWRRTTQICCLS